MFTESSLRQHPAVIKAFMGLPTEAFWALLAQVKEKLPAYEGGLGSREVWGQVLNFAFSPLLLLLGMSPLLGSADERDYCKTQPQLSLMKGGPTDGSRSCPRTAREIVCGTAPSWPVGPWPFPDCVRHARQISYQPGRW